MEQDPQKSPLNLPVYRVLWHPEIKEDFEKITPNVVNSLVKAVDYRLSKAPEFLGEPLKGTTSLLWKISFSKYRIIYTINAIAKEVWVLSAQKREIVYRERHLQSLLKLAISIQKSAG